MSKINQCVIGKYLLGCKIGSGSFGTVYLGTNMVNGKKVAVKLESRTVKNPKLALEYKIYRILAGGEGIPRVHWFGRVEKYNVLVLDVLGPSLHDLFKFCNSKFTLKTVLLLADQLLARIEYVHDNNFIHRDIKPSNFVMGLEMSELNQVFIIDFGLAMSYRNPKTRKHISCIGTNCLTGSVKYASISTHFGIQQSRRDDLESLGYMLVLFAHGKLPWQGIKARTRKALNNKMMQMKIRTPVDVLCKSLPAEFTTFINYSRALIFDEKPEYNLLRQLFRKLFIRKGFSEDCKFDWTLSQTNNDSSNSIEEKDCKDFSDLNIKEETYVGETPMNTHASCLTSQINNKVQTLAIAVVV